jgi:hypothetical protein
MPVEIIVAPGGDASSIYDEAFDFGCLGRVQIQRASHVEPDESGRWRADLSPVGGPTLGPFTLRSEALTAELQWLRGNWPASRSITARTNCCSNLERRPMMRGVLAIVVMIIAYLVLCAVVSCDRGCSAARASPIPVPGRQRKEVRRETVTDRGVGGGGGDRIGERRVEGGKAG